jgi:hypothetical protein
MNPYRLSARPEARIERSLWQKRLTRLRRLNRAMWLDLLESGHVRKMGRGWARTLVECEADVITVSRNPIPRKFRRRALLELRRLSQREGAQAEAALRILRWWGPLWWPFLGYTFACIENAVLPSLSLELRLPLDPVEVILKCIGACERGLGDAHESISKKR